MWNTIVEALGIDCPEVITGVVMDSRSVMRGNAFIALNGGWRYIDEALSRGASVVISGHQHTSPRVAYVVDTTAWLGDLARKYRDQLNATVIGITGSVGKTSLTQMLSQSLAGYAEVIATNGNENNEIGVALTILRATLNTKFLVVEMGVAKRGDMARLVEIVNPSIGIITKIGPSHLASLENRAGVWKEKSKLCDVAKTVILNADCVHSMTYRGHKTTFGLAQDADVCVDGHQIIMLGKTYPHDISKDLSYRLYTFAAAYALYQVLALQPNFSNIKWPVSRMMLKVHKSGAMVMDDCYNANFSSYIPALRYIHQKPNHIVVLGEMGGLGKQASHYHRLLGYALNHFHIAEVWMLGECHRETLGTYVGQARLFTDKEHLKQQLNQALEPGIHVLVKGSRHLALEEVIV